MSEYYEKNIYAKNKLSFTMSLFFQGRPRSCRARLQGESMRRFIQGIFGIVAAALIVYALLLLFSVRRDMAAAEETLSALRAEAGELRRENGALSRAIRHAGDADALEETAREQLGLVLPEDRIYIVENGN